LTNINGREDRSGILRMRYLATTDAMPSSPTTPAPNPQHASHEAVDLDQVAKLVDALEKDLASAKLDAASTQKLLGEIETIKNALGSPAPRHSRVRESLHAIRRTIEHAAGRASGEVWRDALYLAEIGRILGMP